MTMIHMKASVTFWAMLCFVTALGRGYEYDPDYLVPPQCKPCDAMACPMLTFCAGTVVKDHCGCCSRCSSDLFQPHVPVPAAPDKDNVCEERKCPKFQVCMINMQGLPLCTCPSSYICHPRRGKRAKTKEELEVCGTDGATYESRCHMRIANCKSERRIKRAYKGPCKSDNKTEVDAGISNEIMYKKTNPVMDTKVIPAVGEDKGQIREVEVTEKRRLKATEKAKKRRLKRKRRKDRQRRKEKKSRKDRHRLERRNRMKRRNNSQNVYSARYRYLLGRRTQWGSSQVRRNRLDA